MWYYKSNYIEAEVAILIPKRLQNRILQGTETLSNNEWILQKLLKKHML